MIPYDPSPEEICEKCAEIRAGWSEHERLKRAAWATTAPVEVVAVEFDDEEAVEW